MAAIISRFSFDTLSSSTDYLIGHPPLPTIADQLDKLTKLYNLPIACLCNPSLRISTDLDHLHRKNARHGE